MDDFNFRISKKLVKVVCGSIDSISIRKFMRGLCCSSHDSDDFDIAQAA